MRAGRASRPRSTPMARQALALESMLEPLRASWPRASMTSGRNDNERVDDLIVGVAEFGFDSGSGADDGGAEAGFHVARNVVVDQTVGGADLHFRVGIAGWRG